MAVNGDQNILDLKFKFEYLTAKELLVEIRRNAHTSPLMYEIARRFNEYQFIIKKKFL